MADQISAETVNFDLVKESLRKAPALSYKFIRQEMKRFGKRFRKQFIRSRMKGRPGIKWSTSKAQVGGNVSAFTFGKNLLRLGFKSKISRFLRLHEEGGTIVPKKHAFLFLSRKTGKSGQGVIFAKVRSVTIPARLGYINFWNSRKRDLIVRVEKSFRRAMKVALERRQKTISSFASGLGRF